MIDIAAKYESELKAKFKNIWFDDKYKYFNNSNYYDDFTIRDASWDGHQFVSMSATGEIIGYIGYDINRIAYYAHTLAIINFTEEFPSTFASDLKIILNDIFERFSFNKLTFSVVIGNPVEKSYDKLISKYGGRIVGIHKQDTRLIDNKLYDVKHYEILREDYLKTRGDKYHATKKEDR